MHRNWNKGQMHSVLVSAFMAWGIDWQMDSFALLLFLSQIMAVVFFSPAEKSQEPEKAWEVKLNC